ncbi:hypothetical protein ACFQ7O_24030 [Streptomyces sp. NPDC056485]|uniref:hypothetical protein n=1 Tax=Streptomyces sp. NPDC056485 TaxID=3345834 RepID=UPI00369C82D5
MQRTHISQADEALQRARATRSAASRLLLAAADLLGSQPEREVDDLDLLGAFAEAGASVLAQCSRAVRDSTLTRARHALPASFGPAATGAEYAVQLRLAAQAA